MAIAARLSSQCREVGVLIRRGLSAAGPKSRTKWLCPVGLQKSGVATSLSQRTPVKHRAAAEILCVLPCKSEKLLFRRLHS